VLDRKLVRDLGAARAQVATIALVVACGIATFVGSRGTCDSLAATRDRFAAEMRFADVFSSLERAPDPLAGRLREIPGVTEVETRLVFDVAVRAPGQQVPGTARMISLPASGEPVLNRLHLRRGRLPDPARRDEILLGEGFADAHGLVPGDRLEAVLHGRREVLRIAGIALSPEYVFAIRGDSPLPDDESFAVVWIGRRALAAAFDAEGTFNDVVATLGPGAREAEVVAEVDRLLEPWGGRGAHGRSEQPSWRFLEDEIAEQRVMATTIPPIFLGVAVFLLNVVVGRIVASQRRQIATLKALGFDDGPIAAHYLAMVAVVVLAGAALGTVLGTWFGRWMTRQYGVFFHFPVLEFRLAPTVTLLAVATGLLAGAAGAATALRRVARLSPADAMRPPAPRTFRHGVLERLRLAAGLSPRTRMLLRELGGRPLRFALSVLGVAAALGIVVLGLCWRDALDHVLTVQFTLAERGELAVAFRQPTTTRAVRELARVVGVEEAEGYRGVPVELRAGHRSYRTTILGIPRDATLRRLLDERQRVVALPPGGLLLTRQLSDRLGVAAGGAVVADVREGERPSREVAVAGVVDDLVGLSAYMDLDALHRLLEEGDVVNAAALRVDPSLETATRERLLSMGGVATVTAKRSALEVFERTTSRFILFFTAILTAFAVAIAVGVVYNLSRVALQEQAWDLASLRVLGFTRGEVSLLLLSELVATLVLAIPPGLLAGWLAAWAVSSAHPAETFRIPVVVAPGTYARATAVVLAAGVAAALAVRRAIDRLDLVAVLKARD
jgi:putative ABC transport system permease protein